MYSCGPTVYAPPHIGNYRSFLFADLLRRYLEYRHYQVSHVMNITDIDDKTIRDSAKEGLSLKEFTQKYEKVFFEGVDFLNIKRAHVYPRATDSIDTMVDMVKTLVERGYAYVRKEGVYFDISKFKDYGKLSGLNLDQLKSGTRVNLDEYTKESPADFALMKRSTAEEVARGIFYSTPWCNMRPGWHIECSVLGLKNLGNNFDIHTGGVDLIFPHHENEIAQSEAYTGMKSVNFWLHCEHLLVDGEKMSKSLGNFINLQDLMKKGYDPRAIRLILISTHYRRQLNFTLEALDASNQTLQGLIRFTNRLKDVQELDGETNVSNLVATTRTRFIEALDDDLNIREVLVTIFNFISEVNRLLDERRIGTQAARELLKLIFEFDSVLGLRLSETLEEEALSEEVYAFLEKREEARRRGDWKIADEIRSKLMESGIYLEDTPAGVKWKIKKKRDT